MAFKKMTEYNEARYGGFFLLRNDGDYADVVFLYNSTEDVLMADVHYIKSADYSGYVHCCGNGCPACAAGIRVDSKLFIPVYNIKDDQIQFFDRSIRFENQLQKDVFDKYPNPSEYVFRITRHGAANDINTRYEIVAVAKNTGDGRVGTYSEILAKCNAVFPDKYSDICKEFSVAELSNMLNNSNASTSSVADMPDYQIKPRGSNVPVDTPPVEIDMPKDIVSEVSVESDEPELTTPEDVVF